MYLELLDGRGANIKELAAEFLSIKLQQPKSMIYLKLSNASISEDGIYEFDYTTLDSRRIKTTLDDRRLKISHHFFDDFGYLNDYEDDDVWEGEFDPEWFKIVYREMKHYVPTTADEYLDDAREVLKGSYQDARDFYHEEYEEECTKAKEKLDARLNKLEDCFSNARRLIIELDYRNKEDQQQ